MCGCPCSLFVFMSSSYHKRSCDMPYGNQALPTIRRINQLVVNLTVLLALAHTRGVFFMCLGVDLFKLGARIEQPASSMLWSFPELAKLLELLDTTRVHTWMRKFNHVLPKPTVLVANMIPDVVADLAGAWSPKLEAQWKEMMTSKCLPNLVFA